MTPETLREVILAPVALPPRLVPARANKTTFLYGGYTVLYSSTGVGASRLLFDHGPLGYLSIAAHGHSDALAVLLTHNGREIFVDAGTYLYHSGGDWRHYFRSTAAHNTLTIGGRDQSAQAGSFNWAGKAYVSLVEAVDATEVCAQHDGYLREFGVIHRRCVSARPDGSFKVEDRLVGQLAAGVPVEVGFLLARGLSAELIPGGWRISDGNRVIVRVDCSAAKLQIERGQAGALKGAWVSPAFGIKEPASRLVARFPAGATGLTTVISFPAD